MAFPPHLTYLKDSSTMWFNPCWGYHGFWKRLSEEALKNAWDKEDDVWDNIAKGE